jgi:NAD(P)-dependent dehydrogenase (short-subunit alcohol dehydrogenase family)
VPHTQTSLQDRVAVVTGATSGIGRGIAEYFASLGARVVVHGLVADDARRAGEALRDAGFEASWLAGDLEDPESCRRVVRFAVEQYGQIDVLVNNAATLARAGLDDATLEFWNTMINVNLRAPFLCLQEAVKYMKPRNSGSIVNIGSVNAYIGEPRLGPYSVSKGGLLTMTRNAAAALRAWRIRVNQINPGWTLTEGEDRVQRGEAKGEHWLADAIATRPFGRLLSPRDIAMAAAYFASDDSALVSGAVIDVEQGPVGAVPTW